MYQAKQNVFAYVNRCQTVCVGTVLLRFMYTKPCPRYSLATITVRQNIPRVVVYNFERGGGGRLLVKMFVVRFSMFLVS